MIRIIAVGKVIHREFISYAGLIFMIGRFTVSGALQLKCECNIHQNTLKYTHKNVIRAKIQIGDLHSTLC